MTYEHEGFHAEVYHFLLPPGNIHKLISLFSKTLLYMLLQGVDKPNGTLPPPGFAAPHWDALSTQWSRIPKPNSEIVSLGPTTLTIGHDDPEKLDTSPELSTKLAGHEFGWDNEHPRREVKVGEFKISWRPVSNGEFYEFYEGAGKGKVDFPASWIKVGGDVKVCDSREPT